MIGRARTNPCGVCAGRKAGKRERGSARRPSMGRPRPPVTLAVTQKSDAQRSSSPNDDNNAWNVDFDSGNVDNNNRNNENGVRCVR